MSVDMLNVGCIPCKSMHHWLDDFTWNIFTLFPKKRHSPRNWILERTAEQSNSPGQFWHFGETKHVHVVLLQSATSQSSGALHQQSNHQVLSHKTQTNPLSTGIHIKSQRKSFQHRIQQFLSLSKNPPLNEWQQVLPLLNGPSGGQTVQFSVFPQRC